MKKLTTTLCHLTLSKAILLVTGFYLFLSPGFLTAKIYIWVDENGVKHYSNTAPPQKSDKIKSVESQEETPTTEVEPTPTSGSNTSIGAPLNKSSRGNTTEESSRKSNTPSVSEERIERERLKLERKLKHYEENYWQRSKGVISLEEKEKLREPIVEIKEKLQKLSDDPVRYFKEK